MRTVVVTAMLVLALSGGAIAQPAGSSTTVSLPISHEPIRLELAILVDGNPPQVAWDEFLDRFFDFFDRDDDGSLAEAECLRLPPLPLADRKQLRFAYSEMDRDNNGSVGKSELKAFCGNRGFVPLVTRVEQPSADDLKLSEIFQEWLDVDRDGTVTANELRRAVRTMSRYDLDEDGTVALDELLGAAAARSPQTLAPARSTQASERAVRLRIKLGEPAPTVQIDDDATRPMGFLLSSSGNITRIQGLNNDWTLAIDTLRYFPNVKSAGDFLAAQFQNVLGNRSELTLLEIKQDAGLSGLSELAPIADRNSDERLSRDELQSYIELVTAALRSQICVTLFGRSFNVFSSLDP